MSRRPNSVLVLLALAGGFLASFWQSLAAFVRALAGKAPVPVREGKFWETLNFALHSGPRGFWRRPSALRAGRSVSTLLHFVFFKDASFRRK